MFRLGVFILSFVLSLTLSAADIRGTAENGQPVILHDNGTWNYVGFGDPQSCAPYAKNAVTQQQLNQKRGCGFAGDGWHLNYNKHYNWCLNNSPGIRYKHTKSRQDSLTRCGKTGGKTKVCKNYANQAVAQQKTNLRLKCNISGPAWHQDYNQHYNWCMNAKSGTPGTFAKSRSDRLAQCSSNKPPSISMGSTWKVVEACTSTNWIGTWKRRSGTQTFDATWRSSQSGQTIKDVIDLKSAANGQVSLYRHSVPGTYTGQLSADGRKVRNGNATWYNGNCVWTAEISN